MYISRFLILAGLIISIGQWANVAQARVIDIKVQRFLTAFDTVSADVIVEVLSETTSEDTLLCDELFISGTLEGLELVECEIFFRDVTFLGGVELIETRFMRPISFRRAKFTGFVDCIGTVFESEADFTEAEFVDGAYFIGASFLGSVNFSWVDMTGLVFELQAVPQDISGFLNTVNLSNITYAQSPQTLITLRTKFIQGGFYRQEREITYAIEHTTRQMQWEQSWTGKIVSIVKYILFEFTTAWGMQPNKAGKILFGLIILFMVPYFIAISKKSDTGIWRNWIQVGDEKAGDIQEHLYETNKLKALSLALYFSLLSSTRLDWRSPFIESPLTRLQTRAYTMYATGWIRSISGIQSLISLYIIIVWLLTYTGQMF